MESYQDRAARLLTKETVKGRFEPRERANATVVSVRPMGGYLLVEVEVPESWREDHVRPGQYVSVVIDTEPRFLVICSSPGEPWRFLIEPADSLPSELLTVGTIIGVSAPEGPGYPVERGGPLLLIASRSAIASLRPVWRMILQEDQSRRTRIIYAEPTIEDLAFRSELDRLSETTNIEVEFVLPEMLADAVEVGINAQFSAFVCGSPDRMQGVVERLLRCGIPETAIFTNL